MAAQHHVPSTGTAQLVHDASQPPPGLVLLR